VGLPFMLMENPLHGMVVPHPGLTDVIPERICNKRGRKFEERSEPGRCVRMEPHPDRHTVDRLLLERGTDTITRRHVQM
jgi:hypothetical protein